MSKNDFFQKNLQLFFKDCTWMKNFDAVSKSTPRATFLKQKWAKILKKYESYKNFNEKSKIGLFHQKFYNFYWVTRHGWARRGLRDPSMGNILSIKIFSKKIAKNCKTQNKSKNIDFS